jgi:DNA-binding NtrC family response regulator
MPEQLEEARTISRSLVDPVKRRAAAGASPSVMAIDNDPRMLRYIRTILEDGQREVFTCESAEHALECLRNGARPNVVLASSTLADVPSAELLPRIRKAQPQADVVLMAHVCEYGGLLPAIR